MKGVLFNVAEDVVEATLPEAAWERALDDAGVTGVYTSLGDYPDAELIGIVGALAEHTDCSSGDVLRHVGVHGYRHLVARHPDLVVGVGDLGTLLHQLEDVIHPEVVKLQPDAAPPSFTVTDLGPDSWQVEYRSARHLCALAEGLVVGAADGFGTPCTTELVRCVDRGDDHCCLVVALERQGDA